MQACWSQLPRSRAPLACTPDLLHTQPGHMAQILTRPRKSEPHKQCMQCSHLPCTGIICTGKWWGSDSLPLAFCGEQIQVSPLGNPLTVWEGWAQPGVAPHLIFLVQKL